MYEYWSMLNFRLMALKSMLCSAFKCSMAKSIESIILTQNKQRTGSRSCSISFHSSSFPSSSDSLDTCCSSESICSSTEYQQKRKISFGSPFIGGRFIKFYLEYFHTGVRHFATKSIRTCSLSNTNCENMFSGARQPQSVLLNC